MNDSKIEYDWTNKLVCDSQLEVLLNWQLNNILKIDKIEMKNSN